MTVAATFAKDPTKLDARQTVAAVQAGELTAEQVVRAHLDHIAAREPAVHAWIHLDRDRAIAEARAVDAAGAKGPLAGALLGVKDVIETADMPTAYGSAAYAGFQPKADAPCVALSRAAGAVALGKTVSTEFAMGTPGATRNPFDPERTPGGSSSGSAAALGAGMVHLAFGTQTAGSVTRPACYCGVVGFKPTYGMLDRTGIKPLSDSLDTLGIMTRNVRDAGYFAAVLSGRPAFEVAAKIGTPRVALFRTGTPEAIGPGTELALARAVEALADRGVAVPEAGVPEWWHALPAASDTVMSWEVTRALAYERLVLADKIDPRTRDFLAPRAEVALEAYEEALAARDHALAALDELFGTADILMTPAAPDEAPLGLNATGNPMFNRAWTLIRTPAITVPAVPWKTNP